MNSFLWCDHCLILRKIQGHVVQFVLMSLPSVCQSVCVCSSLDLCVTLLGVHFSLCAHEVVCVIIQKIRSIPLNLSLTASWGNARPSRVQRVSVCVSIHTLHPSQLPHLSTPHHIPGDTAAITVTNELANSFITQSTRALMIPWAKLPQHSQDLDKCYEGQRGPAFRENSLETKT